VGKHLHRLTSHQVVHSGAKQYKCETSGKTFTQKNNLKTHQVVHTGEKQYECETCGKTFTQKMWCMWGMGTAVIEQQ